MGFRKISITAAFLLPFALAACNGQPGGSATETSTLPGAGSTALSVPNPDWTIDALRLEINHLRVGCQRWQPGQPFAPLARPVFRLPRGLLATITQQVRASARRLCLPLVVQQPPCPTTTRALLALHRRISYGRRPQ